MNTQTPIVPIPIYKPTDNKSLQCDECEQMFTRPLRLRIHKYNHSGEKPFMCKFPDCSKAYTNQSHLRRHENYAHLNKNKNQEVYCNAEGCGLLLANKPSLIRHKKRHHNEDNPLYPCTECEQRFNCKTSLDAHLLSHSKEPAPYSCDRCNAKFVQFHLYQKHLRNHKTYKCECEESFPRYFWLLDHKRNKCPLKQPKQRKEKSQKFICNICKKEFSSKHNLTGHGIVHKTDAQLYECPYPDCRNSYKYVRNLRWHIKTVHEKLYPKVHCPMENCNTTFKSSRNLRNHLANIHNNSSATSTTSSSSSSTTAKIRSGRGSRNGGNGGGGNSSNSKKSNLGYIKTEHEIEHIELTPCLNEINYSNLFNEHDVVTMNYMGELVNPNDLNDPNHQINNQENVKSIIDYL